MSLIINQVCKRQEKDIKSLKEILDFHIGVAINAKAQRASNDLLLKKLNILYESMKENNSELKEIGKAEVE